MTLNLASKKDWIAAAAEPLVREFETPLYVYSRERIESAYEAYAAAFAPAPHRICYALKANSSLALLKVLASKGAGADIVSGGELRQALRAGFRPEDIVFSGVGKTDEELALGLERGIGEFNVESESELRRLSALAASRGARAFVTLRVNPDVDPKSHPYISTGLRENKFGVPIEEAARILREARAMPGLEVSGVQCHIGSQLRDLGPATEAVKAIASLSRMLLGEGFALRTIDIGGGLGVDYDGTGAPAPTDLAALVLPQIKDLGLKLLLEPGRSLIAAAGALLTRVVAMKTNGARRFVITDAGMNDLLRPSLYSAYHHIENLSRGEETPLIQADIVGPVCESGDFFAKDRAIREPREGDLLVILDAGAYSFSMASNYNFRPRAAEVLLLGAVPRLIRRRETFEDLTGAEIE
ncbi:MAG: diaminopimelate decarboxylase [Vicinamibacteria bacterium]|nr:diaminopimelate decarboxylase [Vicinamibacteria bacterium]